jgi:hypothetical protein
MYAHVYKDKNTEANMLSKEKMELHEGTQEILESHQGQPSSYFYEPWF